MHYLTAVEGPYKGKTWCVESKGLVIGRSVGCDISLPDPSVSRRHCRIAVSGQEVHLEELANRNPVWVNGRPVRSETLTVGDHIGLGSSVFLLTQGPAPGPASEPQHSVDETYPALGDGQLVHLDDDPRALWLRERPKTVDDLIRLYETSRDLSGAVDRKDFLARLQARLNERFGPLEAWLVRVCDGNALTYTCLSESGDEFPSEAVRAALQEGQGTLLTSTHRKGARRIRRVTLAAPLSFGGVTQAVIVVRVEPSPEASPKADLAFLVLLAQSLAPLIHALDRVEQLRLENERLGIRAGESREMVGKSRAMAEVLHAIDIAARSTLNVLILGETGTGKELAARTLHARSSRHHRPLVVVNCAAIPKDLFESELFGHTEGAFTGAHRSVAGLLEHADGGTLLLDEVGDLSLENQARILRVVEDGSYRPIGGREERRVDLRIVAATNKDLNEAIRAGAFREDLYHRLNGFEIHIPPLRARASDIPLLADHFFRLAAAQAKHPLSGIAPEALDRLSKRHWPGNVRELRNCIFRAVNGAVGECVSTEDVSESAGSIALLPGVPQPILSLAEVEKIHIQSILRHCEGNVGEAALILGIGRSTLYRMLTEHRIAP